MYKRRLNINILTVALLALLTILSGFLSSVASSEIPPNLKPYLQFVWPVLALVTLVFIGLTIFQAMNQPIGEDTTKVYPSGRTEELIEKQKRQRMLDKVESFWIKGILEKSLHNAVLIILGLREQQDAIENPWKFIFQQQDQSERALPAGTHITKVFEEASGELLILGEPGSGKTTLLLELLRDLIERAKGDDILQIPVIFNLSWWAISKKELARWIIEELNEKYQVPFELGEKWINNDRILPLLDGLDEMNSNARRVCIDTINAFHQKHMVPLVVCSRSTEYLTQAKRVALRNAVVVQPLTTQQIDDYLSKAGEQLAAVRVALQEDKRLQELAKTPLMLSILALAYQGKTVKDLKMEGSLEQRRQHIFTSYVQRMLQRRGILTPYSPQQTIHWLSWMATLMNEQDQTVFNLDWIHYSYFPMSRFFRWSSLFLSGLLNGLLTGLVFWLPFGLSFGLLFGLRVGLFYLLLTWYRFSDLSERVDEKIEEFFISLGSFNPFYPPGTLSYILSNFFFLVLQVFAFIMIFGLSSIFIPLALLCAFVSVYFLLRFKKVIQLFENYNDFKRKTIKKIVESNLTVTSKITTIRHSLLPVLPLGLIFALLFEPREGLFFGLLYVLLVSRILDLLSYLLSKFILRLLLLLTSSFPLRYGRFLDYSYDHILLYKVGRSYTFIHRLLQDYFASLKTP